MSGGLYNKRVFVQRFLIRPVVSTDTVLDTCTTIRNAQYRNSHCMFMYVCVDEGGMHAGCFTYDGCVIEMQMVEPVGYSFA